MSVTAAREFVAAGVAAGIKASGNADLALVVNAGPRNVAAGVFTSHRFQAAPVVYSMDVLADRALVTMTTHFMSSYSLLAIKTCHKRGAHAIGGHARRWRLDANGCGQVVAASCP